MSSHPSSKNPAKSARSAPSHPAAKPPKGHSKPKEVDPDDTMPQKEDETSAARKKEGKEKEGKEGEAGKSEAGKGDASKGEAAKGEAAKGKSAPPPAEEEEDANPDRDEGDVAE